MSGLGSQIDANFYGLIHQMLVVPRDGKTEERRGEKRHAFPARQRIAPWDGTHFPPDDQFFAIQCRDLTRNGFSFLAPAEPRFRTLVVEFGVRPDVIYVAAQVVRCVPAMCYPSGLVVQTTGSNKAPGPNEAGQEQGTSMFLVGCRFTRRLRRPD